MWDMLVVTIFFHFYNNSFVIIIYFIAIAYSLLYLFFS